ncbi:hypothetical protein Rsub_08206 [Raphidocelis subcapitata]|uniref:Uncharacterized protein n=1 Tax=Raphidocelis subcapitata TaxID=307507 RepID=A0A2V0PD05_9CHLO|nr:hypothetical protein Rsub_08206 [Raphidocelis subcapitata]|eukprot:GBF95770.1 hypothetical protein Rsub_08206 [Raphidocelis subcapitata]
MATALCDRVRVVHKDGRALEVSGGGRGGDLGAPADVVVFEVFDCGLIGEGALHIAAAVGARGLLAPGGALLPARAAVWAAPIEFDRPAPWRAPASAHAPPGAAAGAGDAQAPCFDLSPLAAYGPASAAGGGYFAADLAAGAAAAAAAPARDGAAEGGPAAPGDAAPARGPRWRLLAPPQRAFAFDLAAAGAWGGGDAAAGALGPATEPLRFVATSGGVCNAVAFWFDLDLLGDGACTLTTDPFAAAPAGRRAPDGGGSGAQPVYAPSWRQAVHPLPAERAVRRGDALALTAGHDTYSISFAWDGSGCGDGSAGSVGGDEGAVGARAAASDPAWAGLAAEVAALQGALSRQAAQAPARHRGVARAAIEAAARPVAAGADARHAVELCARIMV